MNDDEQNDKEMDERLRAWASAARRAAPRPDLAAVRVHASRTARRSRMLATIGVGAAVIIAIAGATTAVQLARDSAIPAAQPTASSPDAVATGPSTSDGSGPGASTAAGTTGSGAAPAATKMRQVVFHGLAIEVPAGWPLNALQCTSPIRDTVVLPGPRTTCAGPVHPQVTSAEFFEGTAGGLAGSLTSTRTEPATVDGVTATRLTGTADHGVHVVTVTVPSLQAQVVIRSPDAGRAARLADSLTIVRTGPDGCSSRDDDLGVLPVGEPAARPGADQRLVPGTPTSVVICRYLAGLIEQSTALDAADRASLVSLLNGLPEGLSRANPQHFSPESCRSPVTAIGSLTGQQADDSAAYLIRAEYPSGPSLTVVVRLGLCGDLGASNGTRTGQRTMDLTERLARLAGSSGGFPADVHPADTGTVTGRLLVSPPMSADYPVSGTVIVTNTETHQHRSLSVTDDGRYSVSVAPGSYTIEGHSPQYGDNTGNCITMENAVRVTAGTTTHVDVVCLEK